MLFISLLKSLGIKAYPALVSTIDGHKLVDFLPSPRAFDHVITMVELADGQQFWLDPSKNFQGGSLVNNAYSSYDFALLVGHPKTSLVAMPPELPEQNRKQTRSEFVVSSFDLPVELKVVTQYFGQYADSQRYQFSRNSVYDIEKFYLDYLYQSYKNVQMVQDMLVEDDTLNNIFTVTEHYRIGDFFSVENETFTYEVDAYMVHNIVNKPQAYQRSQPISLGLVSTHEPEVSIRFPEFDVTATREPETQLNSDYIEYSVIRDNVNLAESFRHRLVIKKSYIEASNMDQFINILKTIESSNYEGWSFEYGGPGGEQLAKHTRLSLLNALELKHANIQ